MTNDQVTINTLRELNSRLASEITELRKENAEIPELRKKFSEVEAENIELKTENVKLKQALEEHESRFAKLEQNDKDTAVENAELKARVAKLEQKQLQTDEKNNFIVKSDDDAKGIDQSSVNITSTETENSNDTHEQIDLRCDDTPASDIFDNASNSDEFQILMYLITPFRNYLKIYARRQRLNAPHQQISNEIRERNRKKKFQSQGSIQNTSSSSDIQNEVNPVINQAQNTGIEIPYNKRVEQDLRHDLSIFIKENNNKIINVFDIQIPEFSLEVIITGSTKVTVQNIVDLFILAIKVRQKEILSYEDRIDEIKHINKINDRNEIKTLLPAKIPMQMSFLNKKTEKILLETEVSITINPSIPLSHTSNLEDIVNENDEFSKTINVFDGFLNSNSESSDGGEDDDEDEFLGEKDKSLLKTKINDGNNDYYELLMNLYACYAS
ncbi:hypothetical protein Glove_82g23 [Diversispora epigaea]|uniref:Uncharacterized protein n=1 Tax=Diversispora epigaea TaxID=1348612 RepID=A0A397J7N6_9GLOM|nr:hypothetical protein Glove_82g23 [Diversispora epigaea]